MIDTYYQLVTIKFSKSGKEYSYLCDDDISSGDYVEIEDKDRYYQVIKVSLVSEPNLPVELSKMKHAYLVDHSSKKLEKLLEDNKILKRFGKQINLIGRDDILEELIVILNKKRMRNTILIGEAGCGKTTIVEALADMIKDKYYVLGFIVGELVSGTMHRGSMEGRLARLFNDILTFNKENSKKIILFIDEIHLISNSYSTDECSIGDFMKTYLTNENMILIGATTIKEFNSSIKKDKAMMRRLTPLYVSNLEDESIIRILKDFSNNEVPDSLLELILDESKSIPNSTNPDISIEILDRILARHNVLNQEISPEMILKTTNTIKISLDK